MTRSELIGMMRAQPFIVYGNGYVAHRFYGCIKSLGAASRLAGCVVTHAKNGDMGADGKPVASIADISNTNRLLFIAAHDAVAGAMEKTARRCGFQNIVWIYPWLWQLELGEPIETRRRLFTKELVAAQRFYNLAIDYLTIQRILDGNNTELYTKMQSAWSTPGVAIKRLETFKARIRDAVLHGLDSGVTVKISERCELLDGMHSAALAMYFGREEIYADVYPSDRSLYDSGAIYRRGVLMEDDLPKYYTNGEICEIQKTYRKLRGL